MIVTKAGNLFESDINTLVNTVNCVGVMGAGIAKSFKARFPKNYDVYRKACTAGTMTPGSLLWVREHDKLICNFPTKRHWRENSRIEDIEAGLQTLRQDILSQSICEIALPKLGCGNGGLNIRHVLPLIESYLDLPNVYIEIYL